MSIRAVLDTNVIISAFKSKSPTSPALEILERWVSGEFELLLSEDVVFEYIRKLREKGITDEEIGAFLEDLVLLGESVRISSFHMHPYPSDPDDVAFLLCAANGEATHLVTYDSDFDPVRGHYEFSVCAPIEFLRDVRP